jgi:sulfoxide reductase heme-binding subunit YedZ
MRQPWLKPGVFVGALVPLGVMGWRLSSGSLGADPVAVALNQLGYLAITFLIASLLCTPVRLAFGFTWAVRIRRMLGLFAFFYATLHVATYAFVDQELKLAAIGEDILKRPFILVGFLAWTLLIPLAATSTNAMVKRLGGRRWRRLHQLAYLAGSLAVVHFILRVKSDYAAPAAFGALLVTAFAFRMADTYAKQRRARR